MHNDQRFFALRHVPGQPLKLPFLEGAFNALVEVAAPVDREVLTSVSLQLLQHGMRAADCHGEDAQDLAEIIDELVDEHGFCHDGRTVYAIGHDGESLDDLIDYFILPNDLANTGILLVIGEESDFEGVVEAFGNSIDRVESETLSFAVC